MIVKGKNDEIAAKGLAHTKKANKENVLPITDEKLAQKQVQATVKRYDVIFNEYSLLFCLPIYFLPIN